MVDLPPVTMNPRSSLDATGQRLGALMFRALTKLSPTLDPEGDLAENWQTSSDGRQWTFKIRAGQTDHEGKAITPELMTECLEQYRMGKPTSALRASFPSWKATRSDAAKSTVILEFDQPDPYLARNLSLFRYFRTSGGGLACHEPAPGERVITSGIFKPKRWELAPQREIDLEPVAAGLKPVHIVFVRDETTRALTLLRGQVDVVTSGLSLTKTKWIAEKHSDRFTAIDKPGTSVSYLAFNLSNPKFKKVEVRRAIAMAIPRDEIIKYKMIGFGTLADSFLSPMLPESHGVAIAYDPAGAEKLLDQAGYKRDAHGVRMTIGYRMTSYREGLEQGLMFQNSLRKIGIELKLDVVEPAVFRSAIQKGRYEMYSSRWIGVSDGSILYRALHSGQANNRVLYKDAEMDKLLDDSVREFDLTKRKKLLDQVQEKMIADLPYAPLWYWSNTTIVRKELASRIDPKQLSLSAAYEPLLYMLSR